LNEPLHRRNEPILKTTTNWIIGPPHKLIEAIPSPALSGPTVIPYECSKKSASYRMHRNYRFGRIDNRPAKLRRSLGAVIAQELTVKPEKSIKLDLPPAPPWAN
jgi:hypothetical protein